MENIQDLRKSATVLRNNISPVKKTWKTPHVTEIPKFVILSGGTGKTTEDTTFFISF